MKSKIIVNLGADAKPCIDVLMPFKSFGFNDSDFNLADRTLGMFFENLQHESPFLGVTRLPDLENASLRTIVPLTIPNAIEWLCVFFRQKFEGKSESSSEEVLELFKTLNEMYYNEGRFGPGKASSGDSPKIS